MRQNSGGKDQPPTPRRAPIAAHKRRVLSWLYGEAQPHREGPELASTRNHPGEGRKAEEGRRGRHSPIELGDAVAEQLTDRGDGASRRGDSRRHPAGRKTGPKSGHQPQIARDDAPAPVAENWS